MLHARSSPRLNATRRCVRRSFPLRAASGWIRDRSSIARPRRSARGRRSRRFRLAQLPDKAKVVIIGVGGIVGASVAHHLVERGWDDIVGIDKSGVPTDIGSTGARLRLLLHDQPRFPVHLDDALLDRILRQARPLRARRRPRGRPGRRRRAHGRDPAQGRLGQGLRHARPPRRGRPEIKAKFPLIEEDRVQGGLWDPDAGLVVPRSQAVAGELVDRAEAAGKLKVFANTPATSLVIEGGRIRGVVTPRGTILADHVVVCAGLWGRLIAAMAGEDLPVMPIDHPLTFFGPYDAFAGTGKEIGWPLLRDQGNSAYMRDTGDPKTSEGGMIEWGYYEENNPRLCHPRDLLEKHAGAPVAVAARPRHGADSRAARAGDRADADPGRARLRRAPLVQRPPAGDGRRRPLDRREPEGARASGTRSRSGSRTRPAWASSSPTG